MSLQRRGNWFFTNPESKCAIGTPGGRNVYPWAAGCSVWAALVQGKSLDWLWLRAGATQWWASSCRVLALEVLRRAPAVLDMAVPGLLFSISQKATRGSSSTRGDVVSQKRRASWPVVGRVSNRGSLASALPPADACSSKVAHTVCSVAASRMQMLLVTLGLIRRLKRPGPPFP